MQQAIGKIAVKSAYKPYSFSRKETKLWRICSRFSYAKYALALSE